VATGLLLIVLVSVLLARSMTGPIDELVVASNRLGRGDLRAAIEMDRKDEFRDLADAFNEMRQNLLDRDEQLQMMLSGIAHEVRNPLGGMELFSGLLAEELEPGSQQADYVKKIQRELGYLGRVVSDFLDYARRQPLELERLAARPFLEEVRNLLSWDLDEQGVSLALGEIPEGLELTLDERRLRRVLINLLRNAGQACDRGGEVKIWALELDGPDAQRIIAEGDYAARAVLNGYVTESESWRAICIKDSGQGIEADKVEGIFAPFFTTKEKGSGLGLALAQRTVEEHGGAMVVASTHRAISATGEGGTLMVVLLPFVANIERQAMVIPEGWLG
jgi:signal transduction histidine kinase